MGCWQGILGEKVLSREFGPSVLKEAFNFQVEPFYNGKI